MASSSSAAVFPHPVVVSELVVESIEFPAYVKPPASSKTHFLASAGVRGLDIKGEFVKFSVIGLYMEPDAVKHLSGKWKGKTADELYTSVEFYRDIVTCPFEKFMRVTIIRVLTGAEFSKKVMENCVAYMKSVGTYTDSEAKAVENVLEVFKEETFPPGASILWTQLSNATLAITFSKDSSVPKTEKVVIENKQLSEAVLETMIGKHGVSPATKQTLAATLTQLFQAL